MLAKNNIIFLSDCMKKQKINLESHPEEIEFSTYQFLGLSEIRKMDFGFKNDVYHQALDYFSKIIEKN